MTVSEPRIVDHFWDLRDDAVDNPGRWAGVTAEEIFQRLSELIEEADPSGDAADWFVMAEGMIAWRMQQS